jgi:16S rRNA processing protein RimM
LKRICLGKITKAHGVKGLVKIMPFCEDPRQIETLGPVYTSETGPDSLKIIMKNSAGNKYWLATVDGVTERNGAEKLRGTELWTQRDRLPASPGSLHADLIGLKVIDENDKNVGTVIAIQNFGAGDLLEIQPQGKDSFYLPYATVLEIKDSILVSIPEGLV